MNDVDKAAGFAFPSVARDSLRGYSASWTDRMSCEPDRIRAFKGERLSKHARVSGPWPWAGPFPLLMGVAAIAGAAGSALGEKTVGVLDTLQ